ncbi:MAG: fibronectin type III domain-containing protein, partial [Saprospiraceae bacterium]|nr:fibronectin type III domain-containing protein [Saprospiraceae bacterium]
NTAGTSVTIEGLSAGGQYKFKVKSICSSNSSDHSPWVFFSTIGGTGTGGGNPGGGTGGGICSTIPDGLLVSDITPTSAVLSWNAVEGVTGYEVEVEDGDNTPPFVLNINTESTSIMVGGLTAGGQYKFKVKAVCGNDSSDHSPLMFFSSATEGGTGGGSSSGSCGIPSGLAAHNITDTSAMLSWTTVSGADSYEVEVEDAENTQFFDLQLITVSPELMVSGLVAGGNYKFKAKSVCDTSSSDHSPLFFFSTSKNGAGGGPGNPAACAIPDGLEVLDISFDAATLSWSPVEGASGYEVEVEDNENTTPFNLEVQTTDAQIRVSGLIPGGHYQFKVESICGGESSDHSPWHFFSTSSLIGVANVVNVNRSVSESQVESSDLVPFKVEVFPNPASSELLVDLRDWPSGQESELHVVDFTGKAVVRQSHVNGEMISIPVSAYRSGFYQLIVRSGKYVRAKKFLISH